MLLAGVIAAAGLLFLAFKLGMRKVIGYDIVFDILITAVLMASPKFCGSDQLVHEPSILSATKMSRLPLPPWPFEAKYSFLLLWSKKGVHSSA